MRLDESPSSSSSGRRSISPMDITLSIDLNGGGGRTRALPCFEFSSTIFLRCSTTSLVIGSGANSLISRVIILPVRSEYIEPVSVSLALLQR